MQRFDVRARLMVDGRLGVVATVIGPRGHPFAAMVEILPEDEAAALAAGMPGLMDLMMITLRELAHQVEDARLTPEPPGPGPYAKREG